MVRRRGTRPTGFRVRDGASARNCPQRQVRVPRQTGTVRDTGRGDGRGLDRWAIKPLYCVLYPIEITGGTVSFDHMLQGEQPCCSVDTTNSTSRCSARARTNWSFSLGEDGYGMHGSALRLASERAGTEAGQNGTPRRKRRLVTGGARGIGKAMVQALAKAGASVAFTYRTSGDAAQAIGQELTTGEVRSRRTKPMRPRWRTPPTRSTP